MKTLLMHSYTELAANNPGYKWPRLCPKKPGTLSVKLCDNGKVPLDIPEPTRMCWCSMPEYELGIHGESK
eukprot:14227678-Ditylum_brightwellii.AAC.1